MASPLAHAAAAFALGQAAPESYRGNWRFWCAAALCSILPDIDHIGLIFDTRWESLWGHRGLTHSLLFAAITGIFAAAFLRPKGPRQAAKLAAVLALVTASHGMIDAVTNSDLGVAFFSPFSRQRYLFAWRPVEITTNGVRGYFSARAPLIFTSELIWIWLPSLMAGAMIRRFERRRLKAQQSGRE